MRVVALVPAAGRGQRLGTGTPKALVPVAGLPLITHSLRGLFASEVVDDVVVAGPAEARSTMDDAVAAVGSAAGRVHVVDGGASRTESVRLAMHFARSGPQGADVLLVHDAARAFTPPELIRAVVHAVNAGAAAVIPVLPVADTVRQVDPTGAVTATPDRTRLRVVQTPQGFSAELLAEAYRGLADSDSTTDDAGLVERIGATVRTVAGHPHAMKITTPFDLAIAESVLAVGAPA